MESVRGEIAALRRLPEDDRRKAFKMLCAQSAAPFDEVQRTFFIWTGEITDI